MTTTPYPFAAIVDMLAYQAERAAFSTRPGNFLAVEGIPGGVLISITADGKTLSAPLRKVQLGELLTVLTEHYANLG
jgi:hypothetical protein